MLELFDIDVEKPILEDAVALYDRFDDADNPVPVVKVTDKTYRLGGAGNFSANLAGLDCTVDLIGVMGKDYFGRQVNLLLREKN